MQLSRTRNLRREIILSILSYIIAGNAEINVSIAANISSANPITYPNPTTRHYIIKHHTAREAKMQDVIMEYVEPIYRFCLKRLASRADAEDLSQEILLCILQSLERGNVSNLGAYVWRIAHNRYARLIQARKGAPVVLYGHAHPEVADIQGEEETLEANQGIFRALHSLSAMYRDIMVDFYVKGLDTRTIASLRGVSVETVKWRLHAGREKIRERMTDMEKNMERNYDRVKMHVMCNGGFAPTKYVNTQLEKAIAKVCYTAPLTLEEISIATGVPTLYLEETLEHMIGGDAIERIGSKYATNFIITPWDKNMDAYLTESVVNEATDGMLEYIQATLSQVQDIGFYGNRFPLSHLLHIMIPAILEKKGPNNQHQDYPKRNDGGFGWFTVYEGIEELDWRFAGANGYHTANNPDHHFSWYWVGDSFSSDLNKMLSGNADFIEPAIGKDYALMIARQEDEAKAIAYNLCENIDGRIMPGIPIFTKDEYARFTEWARGCTCLDDLLVKWVAALKAIYKSFTPKRLANQIDGNVAPKSFDLAAHVIKMLQERGLADVWDGDGVFTKGVFMVREC